MANQGDYSKFSSPALDTGLKQNIKESLEGYLNGAIDIQANNDFVRHEVYGGVRYSGDFNGIIYVTLNSLCALKVAQIITGKKVTSLYDGKDNLAFHVVREFGNIIAGNMATLLYKEGIDVSLNVTWMVTNYDPDKSTANVKKYFKYKFEGEMIQVIFLVD